MGSGKIHREHLKHTVRFLKEIAEDETFNPYQKSKCLTYLEIITSLDTSDSIFSLTEALFSIRHLMIPEAILGRNRAFYTSRLDYCNSLLSGCSLGTLQLIQNFAICVLTKRLEHISPVWSSLHKFPIQFWEFWFSSQSTKLCMVWHSHPLRFPTITSRSRSHRVWFCWRFLPFKGKGFFSPFPPSLNALFVSLLLFFNCVFGVITHL